MHVVSAIAWFWALRRRVLLIEPSRRRQLELMQRLSCGHLGFGLAWVRRGRDFMVEGDERV